MNKTGKLGNEKGIAVILALIMLLVMSVLAITVSFSSNNDFKAMSNYKQGQESFLAAERCIQDGRNKLEIVGVETLYFLLQGQPGGALGTGSPDPLLVNETLTSGAVCRTGPRSWHDPNDTAPAPFIEIPPPTKALARPVANTNLPSGGAGGAGLIPVTFLVTGKDSRDKDIGDNNENINTGTEIAVGFESFIPGGASNIYSAQ